MAVEIQVFWDTVIAKQIQTLQTTSLSPLSVSRDLGTQFISWHGVTSLKA